MLCKYEPRQIDSHVLQEKYESSTATEQDPEPCLQLNTIRTRCAKDCPATHGDSSISNGHVGTIYGEGGWEVKGHWSQSPAFQGGGNQNPCGPCQLSGARLVEETEADAPDGSSCSAEKAEKRRPQANVMADWAILGKPEGVRSTCSKSDELLAPFCPFYGLSVLPAAVIYRNIRSKSRLVSDQPVLMPEDTS